MLMVVRAPATIMVIVNDRVIIGFFSIKFFTKKVIFHMVEMLMLTILNESW